MCDAVPFREGTPTPYQRIHESRECPRCGEVRDEWYVDPRGKRHFSRCAPCDREVNRLRRGTRADAPSSRDPKVRRLEADQAWVPLIEAVAAAHGPEPQKHQLLKHALRLVTWSYQPDLASPTVADHIRREHSGRLFRTCDHRFMERAHPVDVAALARDIAAGTISVSDAVQRLRPIVYLTREEHRAVGDFGTREGAEKALGLRLVEWRDGPEGRSDMPFGPVDNSKHE